MFWVFLFIFIGLCGPGLLNLLTIIIAQLALWAHGEGDSHE